MNHREMLAFAASAVALVVVGCASVQSQWKSVAATNTIYGYQTFANKHTKSAYADSAELAIQRLKFQAADKEHTIAAYQGFIKENSQSTYVEQANDRIDGLQFQAARTTNTMAAYKDFIAAHPSSPHVPQAEQAIAKLKADMIAKEPAAAAEVHVAQPLHHDPFVGCWQCVADDKGTWGDSSYGHIQNCNVGEVVQVLYDSFTGQYRGYVITNESRKCLSF